MAIIRGRVVDEAGRPCAGARVLVSEAPIPTPDIAMLADAAGEFVIGAPDPGRYRLRAVTDDGTGAEAVAEVERDDSLVRVHIVIDSRTRG